MILPKSIFIAGYPRSGTTWFANLFNSCPNTIYRHEIIGRCYHIFGKQLFEALKYDFGLSSQDRTRLFKLLMAAAPETDRPPFFPKQEDTFLHNKKTRHFFWNLAHTSKIFTPLYRNLYTPKNLSQTLVIKETRSTINMPSIISGINPDSVVFLFRSPHGAINSYLEGISSGKMAAISEARKQEWFALNMNNPSIIDLDLAERDIAHLEDHEFLSLQWLAHHSDFLAMQEDLQEKATLVHYDNFLLDPIENSQILFDICKLPFTESTRNFIFSKEKEGSDSSSEFYSVFKPKSFSPDKWKKTMPVKIQDDIGRYTRHIYSKLLTQAL